MENIYMRPYADSECLLNDWVEERSHHFNWNLARNQEEWLYIAGELGKGCFPKMKEDKLQYIYQEIEDSCSWLFDYLLMQFLMKLRLSNVDLSEEAINFLKDSLGEEEYEKFEEEARKEIFAEYAEQLGKIKAKKIFRNVWGEDYVDNL